MRSAITAAIRPSTYARPGESTDQPPGQSNAAQTVSVVTSAGAVNGAATTPSTGPGKIRSPSARSGPQT